MDGSSYLNWEIGPILANVNWKKGDGLESPILKTNDGVSWWLNFYPVGDNEDTDGLVFWLSRNSVDKEVEVCFEIKFCFYTTPVKQYTLQYVFEKGEDVHKWIIDDVKNLAHLKIFIPPSTLSFIGYLTVNERSENIYSLQPDDAKLSSD